LDLITQQPDLTLAEIERWLLELRGVRATDSSIDRFVKRHAISFQKRRSTRPNKTGPTWRRREKPGRPASQGRRETTEALRDKVGQILKAFSLWECANYLAHVGYASS
jgi:hypothetical protein